MTVATFAGFESLDTSSDQQFDNRTNTRIERELRTHFMSPLDRLGVRPEWSASGAPFARPLVDFTLHGADPIVYLAMKARAGLRNRLS